MDVKQQVSSCVAYACMDLCISVVPVIFLSSNSFPNESITAMFLPDKNAILFNADWIASAVEGEIVLTAFYETRHAFQHNQIMKLNKKMDVFDFNIVLRWKKEFNEYKTPASEDSLQIDYLEQHIEIDAADYAKKLLLKIIGG